ncbi:hypothetical protein [Sebaldella sp. S0638]|uniref:hypothetical protein n=1 Tax=Sebaldella sp. S0638 TaxID=2957809 RepID=UPI00209DA4CE|nr:hypothetical protein [Sebaldella sp. S0638]MCP1226380.1 hypothetical protein [Sebaldella sp. S0638]
MIESIVYIFCINSLFVILLNVVGLKASTSQICLIYFFIIFFIMIKQKKYYKKIHLKKMTENIFMHIILLTILTVIFYKLYSWKIFVNYASTDPATHVMMVRDFIKYKTIFYKNPVVSALGYPFLAYTNIALFYIIKILPLYKFFIIASMIVFAMGVILFYDLLLLITNRKWVSITGTLFYLFGFNLSVLIFGFIPQLFSITIILVLIKELYIYSESQDKSIDKIFMIKLLLLLIGIQTSYYYYTPQIVFSTLVILLLNSKRSKSNIKKLITIAFIYLLFFVGYNLYTSSAKGGYENLLSEEGFIYRDLYNSFILLIPFNLYFILKGIKYKKYNTLFIMFLISLSFTFLLLVLGMKKIVSGYFYYKNYAYLSILLILTAFKALNDIRKKDKLLFNSIMLFYFLSLLIFLKMDEYIATRNNLLNIELASQKNSVYLENSFKLQVKDYVFDKEETEMIEYIVKNKEKYVESFNDAERLPIVSNNKQFAWFKEMTGIWPSMEPRKKYYFEVIDLEDFQNNNKFKFLVLFPRTNAEWFEKNKEQLFTDYEVEYEIGENKILKKKSY